MTLALSLIFQFVVILASGLFLTTFAHKSLKPGTKLLGLSQWAYPVILGFSPWLLTHTPDYVDLFFSILTGLVMLIVLALQFYQKEDAHLTIFAALLPILVLVFLKSQPSFLNFFYNSFLLTGISIALGILALFYVRRLNLGRFFIIFFGLQILALIITAVNINDTTLLVAASVLAVASLLNTVFTYQEISRFYSTVHHEASYYKDQFEDAVEKEVKKRTFYMELSKEKMVEMNRTDHLTRLLNRKSILADIESLILDKNTTKFVLFVFDIDYFKKINDTMGHVTGDVCLKNLAGILKANSRDYDLLGRYGGDEFLVALPMVGYKEGLAYAQKLMEQIYINSNPRFTISMGMSVYPWDGETYKQLFEVADKGLYLAKEEGRNRIGYKGYIKA